jgi:hypothetical protein
MQNRYTGDMGDFGKFLLLKHLFPKQKIATIWYLYPDESHNSDGSHTVEAGNANLYRHCHRLDSKMAELFNTIHTYDKREVGHFERLGVLEQGVFFEHSVIGEGADYRERWMGEALEFLSASESRVVCLDPDNGIEPASMQRAPAIKRGKYARREEIAQFFSMPQIDYCVIYQHFHRLKKHDLQMAEVKADFKAAYVDKAQVHIIRHNPVQARFYIILSKKNAPLDGSRSLSTLFYDKKKFFTLFDS